MNWSFHILEENTKMLCFYTAQRFPCKYKATYHVMQTLEIQRNKNVMLVCWQINLLWKYTVYTIPNQRSRCHFKLTWLVKSKWIQFVPTCSFVITCKLCAGDLSNNLIFSFSVMNAKHIEGALKLRLTTPSTAHICDKGRISRSIGTNSVQWIHTNNDSTWTDLP